MSAKITEKDLIEIIPKFEKAISDQDLDTIVLINDVITYVFENDGISPDFLLNNQKKFERLYDLVRKSEGLINALKMDVQSIQKELNKKRKISKKYTDVGKL